MTGGDRTDEIRERRRQIALWSSGHAAFDQLAKTDVPWLLAENESLRARVEAAEAERDWYKGQAETFADRGNRAMAERDAALAKIEERDKPIPYPEDVAHQIRWTGQRAFERVRWETGEVHDAMIAMGHELGRWVVARDARIRLDAFREVEWVIAQDESLDVVAWLGVQIGRAAVEGREQ